VEAADCANYALAALLLSTRDEELVAILRRMNDPVTAETTGKATAAMPYATAADLYDSSPSTPRWLP
jgi:hypothetical protein